jgi:hypothetical protein
MSLPQLEIVPPTKTVRTAAGLLPLLGASPKFAYEVLRRLAPAEDLQLVGCDDEMPARVERVDRLAVLKHTFEPETGDESLRSGPA